MQVFDVIQLGGVLQKQAHSNLQCKYGKTIYIFIAARYKIRHTLVHCLRKNGHLTRICHGVSIKVLLSEYTMDRQAETTYILGFSLIWVGMPVHILDFQHFLHDHIQAYIACDCPAARQVSTYQQLYFGNSHFN